MNKIWIWLAVLGVILVATYFVFTKKPSVKTEDLPVSAAMTILGIKPVSTDWAETIKATGPIAAWQEAVIGAEVNGQRLVEVNVNVGDEVKKGQVLAKFNADTLLAEQAEVKADWVQADANARRALSLKDSGAMSAQQLDNFANLAAVAKARLDSKNLQLKYTKVIAPDDGIISARNATLGAVASSGQELFRLIRQNRLEWRGEVTASQLNHIEAGLPVSITLPDGSIAEGVVRQTSPALNESSRMATLYIDIKPGSAARAGMYAEGQIQLAPSDALVVPAKSIVLRDGHNYVFKIASDASSTRVSQQEVKIGRNQAEEMEITEGLKPTDTIAGQGAGFLNDGDVVSLVSSTTPAPSEGQ